MPETGRIGDRLGTCPEASARPQYPNSLSKCLVLRAYPTFASSNATPRTWPGFPPSRLTVIGLDGSQSGIEKRRKRWSGKAKTPPVKVRGRERRDLDREEAVSLGRITATTLLGANLN